MRLDTPSPDFKNCVPPYVRADREYPARSSVAASVIAPFVWTTPTLDDALIKTTFGIIGAAGHFILILALSAASASTVAPFSYIDLLYGISWGFTIFAEVPDTWTVVGALVIIGAGLYVWRRERIRAA